MSRPEMQTGLRYLAHLEIIINVIDSRSLFLLLCDYHHVIGFDCYHMRVQGLIVSSEMSDSDVSHSEIQL